MEPSTKTIYEYLNEKTKNQPLFRDDSGESLTCGQAKAKVDAMAAGLQDLGSGRGTFWPSGSPGPLRQHWWSLPC